MVETVIPAELSPIEKRSLEFMRSPGIYVPEDFFANEELIYVITEAWKKEITDSPF